MTDAIRESRRKFVALFADLMQHACETYQVLPAELWGKYRKRKTKHTTARVWMIDQLRDRVRYIGTHNRPDDWLYVFVGEDGFEDAKSISLPLSCGCVGLDYSAYVSRESRIRQINEKINLQT